MSLLVKWLFLCRPKEILLIHDSVTLFFQQHKAYATQCRSIKPLLKMAVYYRARWRFTTGGLHESLDLPGASDRPCVSLPGIETVSYHPLGSLRRHSDRPALGEVGDLHIPRPRTGSRSESTRPRGSFDQVSGMVRLETAGMGRKSYCRLSMVRLRAAVCFCIWRRLSVATWLFLELNV